MYSKHQNPLRHQLVLTLLVATAALLVMVVGPILTALLAAAALVTWLGAYTSTGLGS